MPKTKTKTKTKKQRGGESHSAIFSPLVQKTRGGGCPYRRQNGGGVLFPASFNAVPIRSFYSQNTFGSDPNYLTVASRNTGSFYGGRGRKSNKTNNKTRKHKNKSNKNRRVVHGGTRMPNSILYDANHPPRE